MNSHFSSRLVDAMKRMGLTQEVLASMLGITHSAVSRWISGAKPRPKRMKDLAKILQVDVRYLEFGEGDEPFAQDERMVKPSVEKRVAQVEQPSPGLNLMGVLRELVEEKERQIVDLRGQLAEKDRQIDKLLGLLDRQTCAVELFATKARAPAAASSLAPGLARAENI